MSAILGDCLVKLKRMRLKEASDLAHTRLGRVRRNDLLGSEK